MDKELDGLLCFLDGKITAFRQKNSKFKDNEELILIQLAIQQLWMENNKKGD